MSNLGESDDAWELVQEEGNAITARLRVPGGWLYRVWRVTGGLEIVFVPYPNDIAIKTVCPNDQVGGVMGEPDITDRLKDLYRQAIAEKSHFYVAAVVVDALVEIEKLRLMLKRQ